MAAAVGRLQRLLRRSGPTALPRAITAMTWSRFFDAYEPVHALVADRTATCWACPLPLPPQHHGDRADLLPAGPVHDRSARGKGVGRALIEAVYERARPRAAGSTGRPTRPTPRRGLYDKWPSNPGSSSIASLF